MQNKLKKFLSENNFYGKTILVGYSAGIDSTSLLYCLSELKEEFSLTLVALHLNHGWRGVESDEDEKFAKNFAKSINVDYYSEKLQGEIQKNEVTAREKRYDFFKKCKDKFGADAVFLAHNREDNVETLIYRIAKGTGLEGLRSIPFNRDFYFRPLLEVSRAEIEEYFKNNDLSHRQDSSNFDIKYKRNFVRHKILPLLKELNPTCVDSISNLISVAKNDYEIIQDKINEVKAGILIDGKFKTQDFAKLKKSYKLEIIQNYVKDELKNPNLRKIEQIVDFIDQIVDEGQDPQFRKWKKFSINSKMFLYINKKEFFKGE